MVLPLLKRHHYHQVGVLCDLLGVPTLRSMLPGPDVTESSGAAGQPGDPENASEELQHTEKHTLRPSLIGQRPGETL